MWVRPWALVWYGPHTRCGHGVDTDMAQIQTLSWVRAQVQTTVRNGDAGVAVGVATAVGVNVDTGAAVGAWTNERMNERTSK